MDEDGRERGEEKAAKSVEDEGDTEDRLRRSAAIPLVRSPGGSSRRIGIYAFRRRLNADVYGLV